MQLVQDLKSACIDLIKILPELNDAQRKEMREILLLLKSDLTDSMVIAEHYLRGVKRATIEQDKLDQLYNAPSTLLNTYNELKICAALYHLHDRFFQWFSTIKGAVDVQNITKIKKLISGIRYGEKYIVKGLRTVIRKLPDLADKIRKSKDKEKAFRKTEQYIDKSIAKLKEAESQTNTAIDAVLNIM
jgi:hypothetical protein